MEIMIQTSASKFPATDVSDCKKPQTDSEQNINLFVSTASGALVVGGVRDIVVVVSPEIGLSVQWSRTNQSVAVCGSLW